jgi:eukaryotic-like serine/threonine-protein kinase
MKDPPRGMSSGIRFGPYVLDTRIAVGGTAEVYLAHPTDPRAEPQRLVVKRLLPNFATEPEGRTMFEREAQLHQAVEHENVVTVFGAGTTEDGEPYLAMEYVDGCDLYRLLRRTKQEGQSLPVRLCVFIICEVLRGLESVHGALDKSGVPLGIIHRDVTPSNLYLSREGHVKLGDFGIARSTTRSTLRSEQSAVLKGKFGYLAPEQVAGEAFDHRADLFSLATVLAEALLGKPLFPGSGQLAVLLAIRDCRIDALTEIRANLPPGLYEVLEKALARDPNQRYQTATALAAALERFEPDDVAARSELSARVAWVVSNPSTDAMAAVRESIRAIRAAAAEAEGGTLPPAPMPKPVVTMPKTTEELILDLGDDSDLEEIDVDTDDEGEDDSPFERKTGEYGQLPSFVETSVGTRHGPWTFARLIEACVTGQIGPGDKVDFMGRGLVRLEEIDELARFLPPASATTNKLAGPGKPDFTEDLTPASLLGALLKVLGGHLTGVLFAERPAGEEGTGGARKELYFIDGKLNHVASSDATELLGEYLVRRGKLAREELDLALAVLPRHNGRMGDTLISLGLVGSVDIFRAIRDQGRDRVADLFLWRGGTLTFYRGGSAKHVEFPLDLDLPTLMLAGLESSMPSESPLDRYRDRMDQVLAPSKPTLGDMTWPPPVQRLLSIVTSPKTLRDVLKAATRTGAASAGDALRALEILLAAGALAWE